MFRTWFKIEENQTLFINSKLHYLIRAFNIKPNHY